jgi:hypothetical protein
MISNGKQYQKRVIQFVPIGKRLAAAALAISVQPVHIDFWARRKIRASSPRMDLRPRPALQTPSILDNGIPRTMNANARRKSEQAARATLQQFVRRTPR